MGLYTTRQELIDFSQECIRQRKMGGTLPLMPVGWAALWKPRFHIDTAWEPTWPKAYARLAAFWYGDADSSKNGSYDVFAIDGNNKLPFSAFSSLPIITCPGLGECLKWCYSLKAWRNPHAFMRQLVNTLRLVDGGQHIVKAWQALPANDIVRLYVDGDIDSNKTLAFWFSLLEMRPDILAYGYSKSWPLFLSWEAKGRSFPSNYVLNLSGGSKYGKDMREAMERLPIARGEFLALKTAVKMPAGKTSQEIRQSPEWPAYAAAVRQAAAAAGMGKVYVCPGKCGDCTLAKPVSHACGNLKVGIPVVIGLH